MKEETRHPEIAQLHEMQGRVSADRRWPDLAAYLLFLRHQKAYLYAAECCKDKSVFEYGCGNGYGSFLLSGIAHHVTAVDINETIVRGCKQNYPKKNLSFQVVRPEKKTAFKDGAFDVVISFQVLEHVYDVPAYLKELKRLLKENGVLLITTPNRKHRLFPFQKPSNPYHVREYSLRQLRRQLHEVFDHVKLLGIDGTPEVNAVEYKRINKSFLKAFVPKGIKRLLKLRAGKAVSPGKSFLKEEELEEYSTEDYAVVEQGVEDCLDFLAIMRKNGKE